MILVRMGCKFGFSIVFIISFCDMIFYAIFLNCLSYYFCSSGFDEFSFIWYVAKFDVMTMALILSSNVYIFSKIFDMIIYKLMDLIMFDDLSNYCGSHLLGWTH